MRTLFTCLLVALCAGASSAQLTQVKLPYAFGDLEPNIDTQTMKFHYGTHYKAYVDNLNKATAAAGAPAGARAAGLTSLIKRTSSFSGAFANTVRNQGGGAWNHALYFKHLAPPSSDRANPAKSISKELDAAIKSSFGSLDVMQKEVTDAGTKVFGSGWSWLCYTGEKLVVTSTPNQDNPLMGSLPGAPAVKAAGCTPILGLDVWEHAYYLKNGPKRAAYIDSFWGVVDWAQVSKNFAAAKAGKLQALVE